MTLPSFLAIGAAKAGSTTIHQCLDAHPDAFVPAQAETHFFESAPTGRVVGEAFVERWKLC